MADRQVPPPAPSLRRLNRTTSHSVMAPETNRTVVKLAGSMLVCRSANRHSSELPAKAIMASDVRASRRTKDIAVNGAAEGYRRSNRKRISKLIQRTHCIINRRFGCALPGVGSEFIGTHYMCCMQAGASRRLQVSAMCGNHHAVCRRQSERIRCRQIDVRLWLVVARDFGTQDCIPTKIIPARKIDHQ